MPDAPAIELQGVSKVFADGTQALTDVNLAVSPGQFCVVLGPSGAGKSTLLQVLNGLAAASGGGAYFAGQPIRRDTLSKIRPRVGTVHQAFQLVPRLTVLKNVLMGLLPRMGPLRAAAGWFNRGECRRACELLDEVGLEEVHLYRRASELSGGQQQRVGIARALIGEPSLVLADEPVASLDPRVSSDVLELLHRACRERGLTVLCSLHQVDLATGFADRVVGMAGGRVVFDGPPSALAEDQLAAIYGRSASAPARMAAARMALP